uniref:NAD(P)(+)--arginine ADP-ribosyltransferase n=1 Tax=Labrus bergylta TaxID=56723 RepID=A0A3Q3FM45_9LABR
MQSNASVILLQHPLHFCISSLGAAVVERPCPSLFSLSLLRSVSTSLSERKTRTSRWVWLKIRLMTCTLAIAKCAEKKPREADKALTKDHMHAICVYTDNNIYDIFNTAVRTEASKYSFSFQFHSLHFLLTSAIQILNSNYKCHTTYRRTRSLFSGNVGQIIRFGSFASSSYLNNLTDFGNETCFKIKTCSGAYLGDYSAIDGEEEVLIPPYETFKVTEKVLGKGNFGELNDCKVVYVLESAGLRSRLNCKAALP